MLILASNVSFYLKTHREHRQNNKKKKVLKGKSQPIKQKMGEPSKVKGLEWTKNLILITDRKGLGEEAESVL